MEAKEKKKTKFFYVYVIQRTTRKFSRQSGLYIPRTSEGKYKHYKFIRTSIDFDSSNCFTSFDEALRVSKLIAKRRYVIECYMAELTDRKIRYRAK